MGKRNFSADVSGNLTRDEKGDRRRAKRRKTFVFLRGAPKVLITILIVLSGFILAKIFFLKKSHPYFFSVSPGGRESREMALGKIVFPESKDFKEYAETIKQRDIFKVIYADSRKPKNIKPPKAEKVLYSDFIKDYRLVGIMLDRVPRAIVEDLENSDTLFLSPGDSMGEAVLEEVQEDRAIFRYRNNLIELTTEYYEQENSSR